METTDYMITSMRQSIDVFINTANVLMKTREIALAHTNLQRAKHLLGLHLKAHSTMDNPYPNSSNSSNTIIDKQADHDEEKTLLPLFETKNIISHLAIVKEFRSMIERLMNNGIYDNLLKLEKDRLFYIQQSKLALEEAKCWLGWELDRIAKNERLQNNPQLYKNRTTIEQKSFEIMARGAIQERISELQDEQKGKITDGYHSFDELYEYRKLYNALLFNEWYKQGKYDVHKSKRHFDGEECFGGDYFIVVALLPLGQISNHYKMQDWKLFDIQEHEKALFPFDGHTSNDVIHRLRHILP